MDKLMIDRLDALRNRYLQIQDDLQNDEIIWAEGIGVSHKFCPCKTTKNVLLIEREVDYY